MRKRFVAVALAASLVLLALPTPASAASYYFITAEVPAGGYWPECASINYDAGAEGPFTVTTTFYGLYCENF